MTEYVRVTWKATGHESSIPKRRFDAKKHKKTGKAAVGSDRKPLPPKFHTTVAKAAAKKTPASPVSQYSAFPTKHGQQADITKESD